MPHTKALGFDLIVLEGDFVTIKMPYSDKILGNQEEGIIHGGAVTTLIDTACATAVFLKHFNFNYSLEMYPTLDLRVDYMCASETKADVYVRAECFRISRDVAFSRGVAYNHDLSSPIATGVGSFMRIKNSFTSSFFKEKNSFGE